MRDDIFVVDETFEAVPSGLLQACLVARNGLFLLKRLALGDMPFIELCTQLGPGYPAEGMADFGGEGLTLHAPKIGRQAWLEVEAFFRAVYSEHCSEAIVLLYFTPSQGGKWRFVAPQQTVNAAHLDWTSPGPAPSGWYLAGSVHSHGSMSAFHSGTDDGDELAWDGVHVTVGKVASPNPEYAASIVIAGQRFKVAIEDLVAPAEPVAFPESWRRMVTKYVPPAPVYTGLDLDYPRRTPRRTGRRSQSSRLYGGGDDD